MHAMLSAWLKKEKGAIVLVFAGNGIKYTVKTTLLQFKNIYKNLHLPAAITFMCIVLPEDWLSPHKVKGFRILRWKVRWKCDRVLMLHVINTSSFQYMYQYIVDAHLWGKYFDFMNTNGCSQ